MKLQDESQTMFLVRSGSGGVKAMSDGDSARLQSMTGDKAATTSAILVVDDSRTLRKLLVHTLNGLGYQNITEAVDGRNALDLASQREFDLILLDIEMPVMDGFEVLQHLKSDAVLRDLPVIVISGQEQMEGAVRAIEMGAEDYLPKPYNPVLLRARVTSSLEKKRLRDLDRMRLTELQLEKEMLQIEKEKSERLLLNILPRAIADRLKGGEKTIAETYQSVTVLFADLVGVTKPSRRTDASEIVDMLNQIFTRFDHLVERHGLEKIKTIGDSYMVVGGLPVVRQNHAKVVAALAMEMIQTISELNIETQTDRAIRIGINTGPVVAGIIGRKKFSYDLWGSTVNLAARLESGGLPGQIHVSQSTYEELREEFTFTERGVIHAKGVGDISTYFLNGPRG